MNISKTIARTLIIGSTLIALNACGGSESSDHEPTKQESAINKIMSYADNSSSSMPTLQDYIDAEVSGITALNLDEFNRLVETLSAEDVDTVEELNTLAQNIQPNAAPVADAGEDKTVQVNQSVMLNGSGSDSDGSVVSYVWKEGENILADSASFSYTPTTAGEHTLTLTVTDDDNAPHSDTVIVMATEILNQAPVADAGEDKTVQVDQSVTINGNGSDNDGSVVSYVWKEGESILADSASFSYTPTNTGEHTLTLTVRDNDGATASDSMVVTVTEVPNQLPTADAGSDKSVQIYQSVTISGSGNDSDGSIVSYVWKKGSTVLSDASSFNYSPTSTGEHTLTLTVTDNDGATGSDTMVLTVTEAPNQKPTANAGSDKSVQVYQSVTVNGSGNDSDGSIVSYEWKKENTVLSNNASFNYMPTTTGEHLLTLTVKDNDGATNSDTIVITGIFDGTPTTPLSYSEYKLSPLSDSEFSLLDEEEKLQVAIKLLSTLYYGTDHETLSALVTSGNFIQQTREMFDEANDASDISEVEEYILNYGGWGSGEIIAPMLARLYHLPPGKEYLNRWAAYVITQTIFFSPAYELNTVETTDVINVYSRLVRDFDSDLSMQWVSYQHMITNENWRRFRSPEDNGREMLEIFLNDFDDAHVPLAAKALQNWELDRRTNTLVITLNENTEPITDLFDGTTIINGTDFYQAVTLQPDFLPTVCGRLVEIYFPDHTQNQKEALVNQLVSSNPQTWTGLLKQIIYSKEYLLYSKKTKSFEEAFYPISKILEWHPHLYSFHGVYDRLNSMHQSTMKYKLGREDTTPLDSQSFAWYHKTLRENVMINYEVNATFESWDDGWPLQDIYSSLPEELDTKEKIAEHIVQSLFVPIIGREADTTEVQFFLDMIDREKYDATTFNNYRWVSLIDNENPEDDLKERGYFASMVLDYLSRLTSTYLLDAVQ